LTPPGRLDLRFVSRRDRACSTIDVEVSLLHATRSFVFTLVVVLAVAGGARAQDTETMAQSQASEQDLSDQQARSHFSVGRAMYDAGRFSEAAAEFQQAYDLSRRPELLYNLYIAYRDSSQFVRARDALRQYLAEVTDVPNRLQLASRLEALEARIAEEERAQARAAADLAAAEQARADAEAAQRRAEAQAARLQRARPWWPWVVFGAGLAAVGVGVPLGVDAASQADAVRLRCTQPDGALRCRSMADAPNRSGIVTQALVGDVLWIAGASAALSGLVLALLLPDDLAGESAAPPLSAACTGDGCHASLTLTFP
jgi:tetratricopeptide (TPR) repeat protein